MLIKVRGVTYPSVRATSQALGVTEDAVYSALHRGSMGRLGLGTTTKRQSWTIGPTTFRSTRKASIALGFRADYLGWAMSKGGATARKRVQRAFDAYANLNKGDLPL
jgi:hypothetical protein